MTQLFYLGGRSEDRWVGIGLCWWLAYFPVALTLKAGPGSSAGSPSAFRRSSQELTDVGFVFLGDDYSGLSLMQ